MATSCICSGRRKLGSRTLSRARAEGSGRGGAGGLATFTSLTKRSKSGNKTNVLKRRNYGKYKINKRKPPRTGLS